MPAPVVANRHSTVQREDYMSNAGWIDQMSVNSSGQVAALGGLASTGPLGATGLATLTGGLAPNKGFPGTSHPVSSSLNAHLTSATVTGNDCAGQIVLVVDATGIAQNQTLCLITFVNASLYANVPIVNLINMTPGAASTTLHAGTYGVLTASATAFSIVVLGAALTASATLTVGYTVTGIG